MNVRLTPEQEALVEETDELARTEFAPRAARWDRNAEYPRANVERLREEGYLGMTVPEAFGGPGRSLLDVVLAIEQVAKYCGVTGRVVVDTNVGALGAVMAYGTDDQRERLATRIREEGDKPAIAMTEPGAGTDLGALETVARRDGDEYVLDGRKHWITGGSVSRTYFVFARIVEDGTDHGIGGLLVDADAPGFEVVGVEDAMGVRGTPEGELAFDGCRVPAGNVVVKDRDEGFKKLMRAYNAQRVCASAVALGIAQGAHDLAVEFMQDREAFDGTVSDLQGPRWEMAEAETKLQAARLLCYRAAANARELDNNVQLPRLADTSVAKAYTADVAFEVVNDALQMFGARGYSKGFPLERMLRDVRMFKIGGGTTEAQKNMIARTLFERGDDERRARLADFAAD
ncbi:MAG: acyl-CoA dehydrogenase family protein [Haloferacaceae archaeon]